MNDKLKPCPFCGGEAEIVRYCDGPVIRFFGSCKDCFATSGSRLAKEGAAENWNKRHYTKSVAMLPCKYCGSKKHWYTTVATGHEEMISCRGCGVEAEWGSSHVQAIRNWNALMQEGVENDDSKLEESS